MMRWGKKKPASSGSSSGLSRAVPVSWLSKFSGMSIAGSDFKPAREKKQDESWKNTSSSSSLSCTRGQSDRCIHNSSNDFQRLPAGRENAATGSEWNKAVGELDFQATSFGTCSTSAITSTEMEPGKRFEEMMNKVQKIRRELQRETDCYPDIDARDREKGTTMIMTPRLTFNRDVQKWKRRDQMLLEEKQQRSERKEKDVDMKATKSVRKQAHGPSMNGGGDSRATLGEDAVFFNHNLQKPAHQWQKLKETKLKEVKLKAEQQRKSLYISRELNRVGTKENTRQRVFSPRASPRAEKCRVKAIEDLKKAKLRAREHKERATEGGIEKESFAVVKCSYDPQKDFKDSMIEMIMENGINRPEELKQLLVCYLTLNTDEYHDMIIKVFREVWGELKHRSCVADVQNKQGLTVHSDKQLETL